MDFDSYKVKMPYPVADETLPTARELDILQKYGPSGAGPSLGGLPAKPRVSREQDFRQQMDAYQKEIRRLDEMFRRDAIEQANLKDHPKAKAAYGLAWEYGHSAGYAEVYYYLLDLADLLLSE